MKLRQEFNLKGVLRENLRVVVKEGVLIGGANFVLAIFINIVFL